MTPTLLVLLVVLVVVVIAMALRSGGATIRDPLNLLLWVVVILIAAYLIWRVAR